jgi:penicillin-binding protein 1A
MVRFFLRAFLLLMLLLILSVVLIIYVIYARFLSDLPQITSISDYRPPAVSSVLAEDGTLIAEYFVERRYPVPLAKIPEKIKHAIIAAEDTSFYSHPGINPLSIVRAAFKNLESGQASQGGSTITQQVVKNLLLSPEKTIERKVKEAILSYQLEKSLSKDGILEIYLNQIYFGNGAHGIKAAAQEYFHKSLEELTLAESALLAGMPKAPSLYSPLSNWEGAKNRQKYVLQRMREAGFVSAEEADAAVLEDYKVFKSDSERRFLAAPFFLRELKNHFVRQFPGIDLERDGIQVTTTLDLAADKLAAQSLRSGLRNVDKRRGWRGPLVSNVEESKFLEHYATVSSGSGEDITFDEPQSALLQSLDLVKGVAKVLIAPKVEGVLDLKSSRWADTRINQEDQRYVKSVFQTLQKGDVIEVSGHLGKLRLDQSPKIEGAIVLLDPHSGRVLSLIGGYDYARGEFNRVTQAQRQPGSAFKPFVYLTAIKDYEYTPASIVRDAPKTFRVGDKYWTPKNYDGKFMGNITLQKALEQSRNLVVISLASHFGIEPVMKIAKSMGIQSPLGANLSLALGSSEVNLNELVRAYGVLPAGGILHPTRMISEIKDRNGNVIYDYRKETTSKAERIIKESVAFVMSHMMRGVIERGTATKLKELKKPVAGKTGTTNDQMDAWFVGFTPQYVCGVWVGFDQKKNIGAKETGGKIAVPIWLNFMSKYLDKKENYDYDARVTEAQQEAKDMGIEYVEPKKAKTSEFVVPDGVVPYRINKYNGAEASRGDPNGILLYFLKGTKPPKYQPPVEQEVESYLEEYL